MNTRTSPKTYPKIGETVARGTAALAIGVLLSAPALAERGEPAHYEPPTFSDMDIDGSGHLIEAEVQGRSPLYGQWDTYDTNANGTIERSELSAFETDTDGMSMMHPEGTQMDEHSEGMPMGTGSPKPMQ